MNKSIKNPRRNFIKTTFGFLTVVPLGFASPNIYSGLPNKSEVFSPGKIGSLKIKNRLIRSATLERAALDGKPTQNYLEIIRSLTKGGVGLIITGAFAAVPPGIPRLATQVHAFDDKYIPHLKKIVETVRTTDDSCRIFAQLVHDEDATPAGINWKGEKTEIVSARRIQEIIDHYSASIIFIC